MNPTDLAKHPLGCFVQDEQGTIHAFHPSISAELKARGVVWCDGDGVWHIKAADSRIIEDKYVDLSMCDFCSERPVTWDIQCDTFEVMGQVSIAGWFACETCGQMIQKGQKAALLKRANERYGPVHTMFVVAFQEGFWEHYKSIQRVTAKPFGH